MVQRRTTGVVLPTTLGIMPSFTTRLQDGWDKSLEHLPLAIVPVVTALLNSEKLGSTLATDGFHFGVKLGIPFSIVDLWTFVDPPSQGATVNIGVPLVGFPLALLAIPLAVVIQAALGAGYFGSIEEALSNRILHL